MGPDLYFHPERMAVDYGGVHHHARFGKDPADMRARTLLDMKLRNMPVPLNAELVDTYMRPILETAWEGAFGKIKGMASQV